LISSEITRVREQYGPEALAYRGSAHGQTKCIHCAHGLPAFFLNCLLEKEGLGKAGYTDISGTPLSWEGSYWGQQWMTGWAPFGDEDYSNVLVDVARNTEMLLVWPGDTESKLWTSRGQSATNILFALDDLGIKSIYVSPDLNYGAAVHNDKWIPILPNTDAAAHLAIAYVWMTEGTYDKDYVDTHTFGFDKWEDYVLGREDGVEKTPEWASPLCGIPEWTIKALAREYASKVTTLAHNLGGGVVRGVYSTEQSRTEAYLLAMQGWGKPGCHEWSTFLGATPGYVSSLGLPQVSTRQGYNARAASVPKGVPKQEIKETLFADAILNPPISWYYGPKQDILYTYPGEGCSEVHMIWSDTACRITCSTDGTRAMEAYRSPKIECFLIQHPWLESDCLFADILLPVDTKFEEEDIGFESTGFQNVYLEHKCMENIGESKSDYTALVGLAEKMGFDDLFTMGMTIEELQEWVFNLSGADSYISWEEFKEKGYHVTGPDPGWVDLEPRIKAFYEDPEANPLATPSGKLEFYSQYLAEAFPDDKERPPLAHYVTGGPASEGWTHDESLSGERAKDYPLLLVSSTPKWRVHANLDDCPWLREICKRKGPDGYMYEPIWMNSVDAAARGINDGDIVKMYNDRGAVLGVASLNERIIQGGVLQDNGSRYDPIISGELDRGGNNNTISPQFVSKNCVGIAITGYLVEVERVSGAQMDEWRKLYPEAFAREYDPAYGLCFDSWVEGGM